MQFQIFSKNCPMKDSSGSGYGGGSGYVCSHYREACKEENCLAFHQTKRILEGVRFYFIVVFVMALILG